jgi:hypothetical protein
MSNTPLVPGEGAPRRLTVQLNPQTIEALDRLAAQLRPSKTDLINDQLTRLSLEQLGLEQVAGFIKRADSMVMTSAALVRPVIAKALENADNALLLSTTPEPQLVVRRDKRLAASVLVAFIVLYVLIKASIAEADLPEKTLTTVNELTNNIALVIGMLALGLGMRPKKE